MNSSESFNGKNSLVQFKLKELKLPILMVNGITVACGHLEDQKYYIADPYETLLHPFWKPQYCSL